MAKVKSLAVVPEKEVAPAAASLTERLQALRVRMHENDGTLMQRIERLEVRLAELEAYVR